MSSHAPGRDVPPPRRARKFVEQPAHAGRAVTGIGGELTRSRTNHKPCGEGDATFRKEDGTLGNRRGGSRAEPKRPPFCLLFEDLDDEPAAGMFGMYPVSFIPKMLPWLRCDRSRLVHVCSGGLPKGEGIRVDIRPEAKPDIIADGRHLPFADASMDAVLIDPPYTEHYAKELYGTSYPRPAHLLKEAARVVRHGGRIGFVHYLVPNPPPGSLFVKVFGLSMGFGYPMRAVTLFERHQASLFGDEHPVSPRQARRRRRAGEP